MYLNQPMRDAAGRETGERVMVALALDTESRLLKTPPDLARALRVAGKPRALASVTPSRRKELIRWVTATRNPETRARRIAKVAAILPRTLYRK